MSDSSTESTTTVATEAPPTEAAPQFSRQEVAQFEADDAEAGRAIGKMLSTIFLYTAVAMTIAAWWTYSTPTRERPQSSDAIEATKPADSGSESPDADE